MTRTAFKSIIRKLIQEALAAQAIQSPALVKKASELKKHYKSKNPYSSDMTPGYNLAVDLEKLNSVVARISADAQRSSLPLTKEELLQLVSDAWDMKAT